MNQQGRPNDALKPLLEAQKSGRDKGARFNDLVSLNLARSYFAAGNFPKAIQGYAAVSRESDFWPEAQFERAWAHFRIDDLDGALGVLYTLNTPFFKDWYFPEADLLRIYSMFYMCKFPEANTEIDAFRADYQQTYDSLKAWGEKSAADNFDAARKFAETGDPGSLPKRIMRPWASEERLLGAIASVKSADDELKRMKAVSANPFSERAHDWLQERRDAIVDTEGGRIKDQLAAQEATIGQMLADTQIFTLDVLRMKTELYAQAAATGKMPDAARTVKRDDKIRKGWHEWPFEGEIWADELGYYRVDSTPECPASMRKGVPTENK
jgi:tetratricopeptide (TPR) repeat protein